MGERAGIERLIEAAAAVRRRAGLSALVLMLALPMTALLLLSALPAPAREGRGSPVPLLVALLTVAGVAAAALVYRRVSGSLEARTLAREADRAAGLGEGDVLAALELLGGAAPPIDERAEGRPGSLAELHGRRVSGELAGMTPDRLLPTTGPLWRRRAARALGAGALALVALALAATMRPGPTYSAAAALGAPWRTAFPPPLPPLRVEPETTRVPRGEPLSVRVAAPERDTVSLVWQLAGEPVRWRALAVTAGEARGRTGPVSSTLRLWAEDARGVTSDTLVIRPHEPLLVQDLRVRVTYPAYVGRGGEEHRGQIPPLVLPEGTRLQLEGETNHPLTQAALDFRPLAAREAGPEPTREDEVALAIDGRGFEGSFTPGASGAWAWRLESADGVGAPVLPDPLRVIVVPDALPVIRLLFPAPDTTLGPDRLMPLVLDVADDLGLDRVALARWRSGVAAGEVVVRDALSPAPAGRQRVVFRHLLDLRGEELLPGDTVFYRIEAFDGHPRRGPAVSDTYLLRVPTLGEIQATRADRTEALSETGRELAEAAEELARSALEAERQRPTEGRRGDEADVGFEGTQDARAVLEEAEAANETLDSMREELERLREEVGESALSDPALADQLEKLVERYRELLQEGLGDRIEELARALRELDPEAVREALRGMSEDADALRRQIEETLGLLEQAALEQAVKSAREEAEELADRQRAAAEETTANPEDWAAGEERLAAEAETLAEALDEIERRLEEASQQPASDSAGAAGERASEAAAAMRQAAAASRSASEGQAGPEGERAQQSAEQAAAALEEAAAALQSASEELGQGGRTAEMEALARARAEALELAAAEADLAVSTRGESPVTPEAWRARQAALRQGLENLIEQLSDGGSRSTLLDRETGAAAGEAAERMDRVLERMVDDGARRLPSRAEADRIAESLNELAARLLASETAARAAQQNAGGEQAAEQMARLAQQQQGVTQRTSALLVPGPKPPGSEERAREIAERQADIADRLRALEDPEQELLGRPEELAREADEIARRLETEGASAETLDRQRRLFGRMLDAGRSLEDDDLDPSRRESRTGRADPREPPPIDPALLRGSPFPLPSEALLRDLPVFYRPLIFEYFDRLNRDPALLRGQTEPTRGGNRGG